MQKVLRLEQGDHISRGAVDTVERGIMSSTFLLLPELQGQLFEGLCMVLHPGKDTQGSRLPLKESSLLLSSASLSGLKKRPVGLDCDLS